LSEKYDYYYRSCLLTSQNLAVLVVDNGSPYVKDITTCLDNLRQVYDFKRYDEELLLSNYQKVILSGRRKNKKEINSINSKIIKTCYANETPLLGICYGAEIIALTFGGTLHRTDLVQGFRRINVEKQTTLLEKAHCDVYESHSYAISHLPENFICVASSDTAKHEIICHNSKKIFGTQFHPEKSGECGTELIRNFVSL
jgi:GMP synthase (glutamine-hydrolysing)